MLGFINRFDKAILPPYRDWCADVSSVSPSSERIKELWIVCGLYSEQWKHRNVENKNKLVEQKVFVDSVGIKSADLEDLNL